MEKFEKLIKILEDVIATLLITVVCALGLVCLAYISYIVVKNEWPWGIALVIFWPVCVIVSIILTIRDYRDDDKKD